MAPIFIAVQVLLFLSVCVATIFAWRRMERASRAFDEFALRRGLVRSTQPGPLGIGRRPMEYTGVLDGVVVTLGLVPYGRGRSKALFTRVAARVERPVRAPLVAGRKCFQNTLRLLISDPEVDVGAIEFDERAYVRTKDRGVAQEVLNGDVRERLLAFPRIALLEADRDVVSLRWQRCENEVENLERATELVLAVARDRRRLRRAA